MQRNSVATDGMKASDCSARHVFTKNIPVQLVRIRWPNQANVISSISSQVYFVRPPVAVGSKARFLVISTMTCVQPVGPLSQIVSQK